MGLKFFFFFAMLVSPYDVISWDVINIINFREILRYFIYSGPHPDGVQFSVNVYVTLSNFESLLRKSCVLSQH